jgi:ferric-dicitrate binding protein FerR (iron transport regulator)
MKKIKKLQSVARGERPRYFDDPAIDKVLSIALALAGEVAVMRDRVDTLERLLEAKQVVSRDAIDAYKPPDEVSAQRDAWRDGFLDVVMRSVRQELEALELNADQGRYKSAIDLVEKE